MSFLFKEMRHRAATENSDAMLHRLYRQTNRPTARVTVRIEYNRLTVSTDCTDVCLDTASTTQYT